MSYLTRITLSAGQAAKLRLHDAYAWHQAIWTAFPGRDGQPRDFLYRVDHQQGQCRVLLLSPGAPEEPAWGLWEPKEVAPSFLQHDRYVFELRANPTYRRREDRRRLGLHDEAELRAWFADKAAGAGFAVAPEELAVGAPIAEYFYRRQGGGGRGKLLRVDFRGALTVTDRAAFTRAFHTGIGTAKGLGFGLLMLQPR